MEGQDMDISRKHKKRKRLEVKMEMLNETGDQIAPLVGYFPSGFDPQNIHKQEGEEDEDPKIKVYRNKDKPKRLELVVSPKGSEVDFVGTSYSGEAAAAQICSYALGILDKDTNSLKIVRIAANKIFRLEPRVRTLPFNDTDELPKPLNEEELTKEKKAEQWRELSNAFGTDKARRLDKKKDLLSLKQDDPEAQKEMDRRLEGVKINEKALEDTKTDADHNFLPHGSSERNIPPHDSTATMPEKAYLLDKIILKGEWDYLMDVLDLMQSGRDTALTSKVWEENAYPSFVCNRIHKLVEVQDEEEKQQLAGIFSYITLLVKFKDLQVRFPKSKQKVNTSAIFHSIPSIFYKKFTKLFVESESREVSNEKQDLLVSYILVLTLFADGFETEPSDIAKDLKMTPLSLRPHYQNLGCMFKHINKSALVVTLSVPLKFPELKKKRVQRKR